MNNKELIQKRLPIYISLLVFFILTFLFTILMAKNLIYLDQSNMSLKRACINLKSIIEKELKEPSVRFTSLFRISRLKDYTNVQDYNFSYNYFKKNKNKIFLDFYTNISFIEQNINKNKDYMPIIKGDITNYTFVPISYVKIDKLSQIGDALKTGLNDYFELSNNQIFDIKYTINYLFIEVEDKKLFALFSSPKDPDPLYPGNLRHCLLICMGKTFDKNRFSSYHELITIKNK